MQMKQYVETVSRGLTLRGFLELPENVEKPPLLIMFTGSPAASRKSIFCSPAFHGRWCVKVRRRSDSTSEERLRATGIFRM